MAAGERVVFTLKRTRKRKNATKLAIGAETVASACENLVAVGLMTYIPYDTVVGRVEHIVECHRQFHHAQTRCEMAGIDRHLIDNVLSEFTAYLRQLVYAQPTEV